MGGQALGVRASLAVADLEASLDIGAQQIADDFVVNLKHTDFDAVAPINLAIGNDLGTSNQLHDHMTAQYSHLKESHQRAAIETGVLIIAVHREGLSRSSLSYKK